MSKRTQKLAIPDDVQQLAASVFGSSIKALRWLNKPNRSLNGERPISRLNTIDGIEKIKIILLKIEYGVYS